VLRESSTIPTATKSHFPETDKQALTAHELSRETLGLDESSNKDKDCRFAEIPRKFLDTRSREAPSREVLSSLQQLQSSHSMSKQEPKSLNSYPTDALFESEQESFPTVSEKSHALLHKRKFGLLPPTPSIISSSPRQFSTDHSKQDIISQSSTMFEVLFTLLFFIIPSCLFKICLNLFKIFL
uniref:Muscular LMNA interacting protein n=1 Tax=Elaeophora elaphi TaxID=1147741 RepID=A0A0R3RPZ2_9BILA